MKYAYGRRRAGHAVIGIAAGVLVVALLVIVTIVFLRPANKKPLQKTQNQPSVQAVASDGGISSHMLFVGDVFWGRDVQRYAEASPLGTAYITSGLSEIDRKSYDAWIANFECPITTKDIPFSRQVSALQFNCRPEYLPELAKWFTAASLANNHTMNNGGEWGLGESRKNMEAVDIQPFGTYDMKQTNELCEVVAVPAKTTKTNKVTALPVAFCGYMQVVDVPPTDEALQVMKRYAAVMPVVAMPHMGVEYRDTAEQQKIDAYHALIDNGADVVIGAHPHVIQNSEAYKGKLIAYSLGNFLFDQQSLGSATTTGLAVGLTIGLTDEALAKKYSQVAKKCSVYKDTCLAELEQTVTKRPSFTASYSFTCYDQSVRAGRVPTLGSEQVCAGAKKTATTSSLTELAAQW